MNARLRRLGAAFLVLLILAFQSPVIGTAAENGISKTFTGFAFEKSTLTSPMKNQIVKWVTSNPGYAMISCTGYTGHNVKNRTPEFLQKVAEDRAKNTCAYIKSKYKAITIYSTVGIPEDGKTPDARKVTVRLLNVTNNGGGTGSAFIGICDDHVDITMKSRFAGGRFYFSTMSITNISSDCRGNVLDVYLIDGSGNQISLATSNAVTATSMTVSYTNFDTPIIRSDAIKQVAIEIRAPQ